MGNYKFKFSDMIPNAWFHKLKDMSKPRSNFPKTLIKKKLHSPPSSSSSSLPHINHTSEFTNHSDQRKSYYFTRDLTLQPHSPLPQPPRKSSQRRRRSTNRSRPRSRPPPPPPRLVSSSISAGCSCRATVESVWAKPQECTYSGRDSGQSPDQSSSSEPDSVLTEYGSDRGSGPDSSMVSWSSPCKCGTNNDIIIDIDNGRLAPIITKRNDPPPATKIQRTSAEFSETNAYRSLSVKVVKEDFVAAAASPVRRLSAKTPGMKLRVNSPKIANRRIQGRRSVSSNSSSRRSICDSFAVVKASKDPGRDFRESMVEMILQNNIRASNDLEELLACYLSLNSDQYHDLIVNVFKQIWFDFIHLRLN